MSKGKAKKHGLYRFIHCSFLESTVNSLKPQNTRFGIDWHVRVIKERVIVVVILYYSKEGVEIVRGVIERRRRRRKEESLVVVQVVVSEEES